MLPGTLALFTVLGPVRPCTTLSCPYVDGNMLIMVICWWSPVWRDPETAGAFELPNSHSLSVVFYPCFTCFCYMFPSYVMKLWTLNFLPSFLSWCHWWEDTRPSPALLYWKWWKAGQGLGTRLLFSTLVVYIAPTSHHWGLLPHTCINKQKMCKQTRRPLKRVYPQGRSQFINRE